MFSFAIVNKFKEDNTARHLAICIYQLPSRTERISELLFIYKITRITTIHTHDHKFLVIQTSVHFIALVISYVYQKIYHDSKLI